MMLLQSPGALGGEDHSAIFGVWLASKQVLVYATAIAGCLLALVAVERRWRGRPALGLLSTGWASLWVLVTIGILESFGCACADNIVVSRDTGSALDLSLFVQMFAAIAYWMIVQARQMGAREMSAQDPDPVDGRD